MPHCLNWSKIQYAGNWNKLMGMENKKIIANGIGGETIFAMHTDQAAMSPTTNNHFDLAPLVCRR